MNTRNHLGLLTLPLFGGLLAGPSAAQSVACSLTSELTTTDPDTFQLGYQVVLDGENVIASAPGPGSNFDGKIFVFERVPGGWQEVQILTGSQSDELSELGASLDLSGDRLVAGAPYENGSRGACYVFERAGSSWVEQQRIVSSDIAIDDRFGWSVAIDGNRLVVGAPYDNGPAASGSVYVFEELGGVWVEQQKLKASDATAVDHFGWAVALDGGRIAVGSPDDHHSGFFDAGSVYVFDHDGASWSESQKLITLDPANGFKFGTVVEVAGSEIFATAIQWQGDVGGLIGSVYVFGESSGTWTQQQQLFPLGYDTRSFGRALSIDGDRLAIATTNSPLVQPTEYYLFQRVAGSWILDTFFDQEGDGVGVDIALGSGLLVAGWTSWPTMPAPGKLFVEELIEAPAAYCTAKTTSNGCVPQIRVVGAPSVQPTPWTIQALAVPNQKPGLLFYGHQGATAAPFFGGTLCVQPPLIRTAVQNSAGNGPPLDCSGTFSIDFSVQVQIDPLFEPGGSLHAQYWFRDPAHPDGTGVGLSDAVGMELCP